MAEAAGQPEGPVAVHPSMEEKKGPCGVGLAIKWDNIAEIRHRMREGYNLLIHYDAKMKRAMNCEVERTMQNVKANLHVLQPVCKIISTDGLPVIDELEYDVKQMFSSTTSWLRTKQFPNKLGRFGI